MRWSISGFLTQNTWCWAWISITGNPPNFRYLDFPQLQLRFSMYIDRCHRSLSSHKHKIFAPTQIILTRNLQPLKDDSTALLDCLCQPITSQDTSQNDSRLRCELQFVNVGCYISSHRPDGSRKKIRGCFTNLHKMVSMRCENKIPKLREEDIHNFLKSDERCSRRRKVGRVLGGDETRKRCLSDLEFVTVGRWVATREAHRDRKDDSNLLWIFLACGYVSQDWGMICYPTIGPGPFLLQEGKGVALVYNWIFDSLQWQDTDGVDEI